MSAPATTTTTSKPGWRPTPGLTIRRRVIVHGRVQGVFFRETTRRRALERGVTGWVRNRRDGTVEAVFEGEPPAVEEMLRFSREGPEYASVEAVEVLEEEPVVEGSFEVR